MLFSVRSHYLFTIGLEECLAFAVDACDIREGYPTPATLEPPHSVLTSITGLSPCFVLCSKRLRRDGRLMRGSPDTTLPVRASVWAVSRSLAITNDVSELISLPTVTEMFQFTAFPIARSNCVEDSYSGISGSSPPCGSPELIAAWHALRRLSSRAIHRMA